MLAERWCAEKGRRTTALRVVEVLLALIPREQTPAAVAVLVRLPPAQPAGGLAVRRYPEAHQRPPGERPGPAFPEPALPLDGPLIAPVDADTHQPARRASTPANMSRAASTMTSPA